MDPKSLFSDALTFPQHEANDIHYIGEALPTPSQIMDVNDSGQSSVGGSGIPAREDHTHGVDLSTYYTKTEIDLIIDDVIAGDLDLSNYYTKAEADALFYSQTILDAVFANIYTMAEVDALIAGVGGGGFGGSKVVWEYTGLVAPGSNVNSSVQYAGDIPGAMLATITHIDLTLRSSDLVNDIFAGLFINGVEECTLQIDNTETFQTSFFTVGDDQITNNDPMYIKLYALPSGTAYDLNITVHYAL